MHANEHPKNEPSTWRQQAACKNLAPATFFPGKNQAKIDAALTICRRCPVQAACYLEAIDEEAHQANTIPYGIRGGATAYDRRLAIRNRRRLQRVS